jgi:RNA polymerase sigma-70 factor (ECF subfamily)
MAEGLEAFRPRMMSIAYRMLGSVADAEDAVQDAFLRLQTAESVTSPEGFLVRTTTRLCIDRLRMRRRTTYVGPWVPEPIETRGEPSDFADSLTQAFLLLLERLTPNERAALLLRAVFDYEYAEIGEVVGKSEANVRQLVSRARRRLGLDETRFRGDVGRANALAERFVSACRAGDLSAIEGMLSEDAQIHSDGGGKAFAARVVIRGSNRSARFLSGVFRKHRDCRMTPTSVNGEPGLAVSDDEGKLVSVFSFHIDERVHAVYVMRNPDKLARWSKVDVE